MPKKKKKGIPNTSIKQRAEKALETLHSGNGDPIKFTPDNMKTLIHDLQVHQIELEMQNDELRRTEEKLAASQQRYFDLYDLAPVGYITVSEKGLLLKTNLTATNLLGKYRNEMIKQPISNFILTTDQDIYYHHRKLLFETGELQKFELRMVQTDKLHFWANLDMAAAQDEDGTPEYRIVISDITERKQAEESLLEHEEQYRAVVDNTGDYIMRYDKNFRHIYANRLALEATGLPIDQYIGKTHREMGFPDHLCKLWKKNIKLVFDTGKQQNIEFDVELAEGNMSLELQLNPEFAADGSVATVIGISRDITSRKQADLERKRLESRLHQAQKMESIGQLAGGIAHDFNNILYPIIGFTEISIEDLPKDHPVQENLIDILQGAKRARDLVKQILSFSNQRDIEQKTIPLQPLIKETLNLLRATIPSNIEIKQNLFIDDIYIFANATEIHEIIMNLCTNSYHAMEKNGGRLTVGLHLSQPIKDYMMPSADYCCLSISDTGSGIPQEMIDNVFDPYFTTKEQGKGSGLGLSVIHGIVESYNGKIEIQSEPEKGTTVNVFIPVTSKRNTKVDPDEINDCTIQECDEQILFVDDEKSIVKLGGRILERLGYTVTGKDSSIEALELFTSNPDKFDLVITDMTMPGLIGTQLSKRILEIRSNIPILICTGFSEQLDKETARSYGIKGYINKPILQEELTSKVRELLDQNKENKNV